MNIRTNEGVAFIGYLPLPITYINLGRPRFLNGPEEGINMGFETSSNSIKLTPTNSQKTHFYIQNSAKSSVQGYPYLLHTATLTKPHGFFFRGTLANPHILSHVYYRLVTSIMYLSFRIKTSIARLTWLQ